MPLPAIVGSLMRMAPQVMGGGAAGEVATGTMAGQAISALVQKIGEAAHAVMHPLQTMQRGMDSLKQTLTAIPATILKARETIAGIGRAWVEALAAPIKTVKDLGDAVNQFVRLSNPAAVKMFEYHVENTFATIGRILEPILLALTRAAKSAGDAFASMKPVLAPVVNLMAGLIDDISAKLGPTMRDLSPVINSATFQLNLFINELKILTTQFEMMAKLFKFVPTGLLDQIGRMTGGKPDANATTDIAIRQPQFTNINEIQKEMAKNSLMASLGPQAKKETTESLLKQIYDWLRENLKLEKLKDIVFRTITVKDEDVQVAAKAGVFGPVGQAGAATASTREQALEWLQRRRTANFGES